MASFRRFCPRSWPSLWARPRSEKYRSITLVACVLPSSCTDRIKPVNGVKREVGSFRVGGAPPLPDRAREGGEDGEEEGGGEEVGSSQAAPPLFETMGVVVGAGCVVGGRGGEEKEEAEEEAEVVGATTGVTPPCATGMGAAAVLMGGGGLDGSVFFEGWSELGTGEGSVTTSF